MRFALIQFTMSGVMRRNQFGVPSPTTALSWLTLTPTIMGRALVRK